MKQITVRKKCDRCKEGEMKRNGIGYSNSAASYYDHVCNNCGAYKSIANESFPYTFVEFEEKEKEERWE